MTAWWDSGPGAEERAKKREEESRRRTGGSSRVWQRPGQKCTVTLISQNLAYFTEHNIKTDDTWGRYVCLEGTKTPSGKPIPCPFCLSKEKQEFQVYVGTCINHTGFSTKSGDRIEHVKQALVLKGLAKQMFFAQLNTYQKQYGNKWSLEYTVWEIQRDSSPSSHTPGIIFNYLGNRSREKLIAKMEAAGQSRDDWDAYLTPYSVEQLVTYLEPEDAYALKGIPYNAPKKASPVVNPDDEWGDIEYPGSSQFDDLSFLDNSSGSNQIDKNLDDIEVPLVDGPLEADDDDAKELEDYEALK